MAISVELQFLQKLMCCHASAHYLSSIAGIDVVDIIETDQSCQEHGESNKATDGKFNDLCHCSKIKSVEDPWWRAKLSGRHNVTSVVITNRPDCCRKISYLIPYTKVWAWERPRIPKQWTIFKNIRAETLLLHGYNCVRTFPRSLWPKSCVSLFKSCITSAWQYLEQLHCRSTSSAWMSCKTNIGSHPWNETFTHKNGLFVYKLRLAWNDFILDFGVCGILSIIVTSIRLFG